MWWNCVAAYSSDYKDTLTKEAPLVQVPDPTLHTSANRVACMAQTIATYLSLSIPEAQPAFLDVITGNNPLGVSYDVEATLDPFIVGCGSDAGCLNMLASDDGYSPAVIGQIVAKMAYDYSIADGYNQLGKDDGCAVSCRAYKDTTGYVPSNIPGKNQGSSFEEKWEPLLEDNGKGFFYRQEHVTPHIGTLAKLRFLPESERDAYVAADPDYSKSRIAESLEVTNVMSQLDDMKKVEVEIFEYVCCGFLEVAVILLYVS